MINVKFFKVIIEKKILFIILNNKYLIENDEL